MADNVLYLIGVAREPNVRRLMRQPSDGHAFHRGTTKCPSSHLAAVKDRPRSADRLKRTKATGGPRSARRGRAL
jgi:hypothetical protein